MSKTVLFAGGPLHGKTMAVEDHTRVVHAMEPLEVSLLDAAEQRQVAYTLSRFAICRRVIWVGWIGAGNPEENPEIASLVFEVLTSDGAKEASYVPIPA